MNKWAKEMARCAICGKEIKRGDPVIEYECRNACNDCYNERVGATPLVYMEGRTTKITMGDDESDSLLR